MKQIYQIPKTGEIVLAEVPVPQLRRGCALVRVRASVISAGTERMATEFARKSLLGKAIARPDLVHRVIDKARRDGILTAYEGAMTELERPQSLGYSCAGTVIAVGEDVLELKVGDRVACGGGDYAGHAEVICVPKNLTAKLPERGDRVISFEEAAFATLGAVAVHGLRLSEIRFGETVAIIGLGVIGLVTAQLVRAAGGVALGMDLDAARSDLARQLGCAASTTSDEEFRRLCEAHTKGIGTDAVIITAASESNTPIMLAAEVARSRARVVSVGAVGLELPRKLFFEKELSFVVSRSYGPGRYDPQYEEKGVDYPVEHVRWTEQRNMGTFLDFISRGEMDLMPLITHRLDVSEAERAYDIIGGTSKETFLGVVLQYNAEAQLAETVPLRSVARVSESQVRLGVIGAGVFANRVLIPEFRRAGASLEGLCTLRGISGYHIGSKSGFRYCTTDPQELLQDDRINAVVIATRHFQHSSQILPALASGKHVFCEKPLCLTQGELQQIREFYFGMQEPRPLLMVGYNRRFAPMLEKAKRFLAMVTEPLMISYRVSAGFVPRDSWIQDSEVGGGRILGEICHFVDTIHFLTGSTTKRVTAKSLSNDGRYCDDNVVAILELERGSVATITYNANGDRALGKERIEVFADGRSVVLDDFRRLELATESRRKITRSWLRQQKGHRQECAAFVDAVTTGIPSPTPFDQITSCTATTFAILESIKSGGSVELSECSSHSEYAKRVAVNGE